MNDIQAIEQAIREGVASEEIAEHRRRACEQPEGSRQTLGRLLQFIEQVHQLFLNDRRKVLEIINEKAPSTAGFHEIRADPSEPYRIDREFTGRNLQERRGRADAGPMHPPGDLINSRG